MRARLRELRPRPEIVHVDVQATVDELRELFIESGLSRILVTDGDLDAMMDLRAAVGADPADPSMGNGQAPERGLRNPLSGNGPV